MWKKTAWLVNRSKDVQIAHVFDSVQEIGEIAKVIDHKVPLDVVLPILGREFFKGMRT